MRGLVSVLWMLLQSNYPSSHLSGWKCQPYKGWWPSLLIFAKLPTYWLKSQRIMSLSHALLTSGLEVRSDVESDVLAWNKICREWTATHGISSSSLCHLRRSEQMDWPTAWPCHQQITVCFTQKGLCLTSCLSKCSQLEFAFSLVFLSDNSPP